MNEIRRKIPLARPVLGALEKAYVNEALESGWVSSIGKFVERFEREFAEYCGARYGVSTSNGTSALHLALRALNLRAGEEVLIPDLTFIAVPNAVRYQNAVPVLVDCDEETWCINPKKAAEKVTHRTRGIIAVHSYGAVCQMDELRALAESHHLFLLEDAAEAHGATYRGRRVGSLGDVACFSFYGNKIITTGEGGMIVTDDAALANSSRILKDHGMSLTQKYLHPEIGYNYRMTNLQAALGVAQLQQIEGFLARRTAIESIYRTSLEEIPGIRFQTVTAAVSPVCWLFSILITEEFPVSRDEAAQHLAARGVETRPFFVPIHRQPPYAEDGRYPISDSLSAQGLNLPSAPDLTAEEIAYVCDLLKALAGERKVTHRA